MFQKLLMAMTSDYNSKFKETMMLDDGLNGDLIANDGIYTVMLSYQNSGRMVKYFIKAIWKALKKLI